MYDSAMQKPDYSYQKPLIRDAYKGLHTHKKIVLAACPGAGKTVMAIEVIKKFLKENPKSNVLILTHGQTILRNQWSNQLSDKAKEIPYAEVIKDQDIRSGARVYIGIPQSYRKILKKVKHIDLLVIDEAHHYYAGQLIGKLKAKYLPEMELLLTGTPSMYINKPEWKILGITLQELLDYGTVTDPTIELVESKYSFQMKDYNKDLTLNQKASIKEDPTIQSLEKVLKTLIGRLKVGQLSEVSKTMIVCHSQQQAKYIYKYLKKTGQKPILSISDMSRSNQEIDLFKADESYKFLIVVNRGILGFDFAGLVNVIDFTESLNVNRLFQLLCRIVRKDSQTPKREKLYLKLSSQDMSPISYYVMSFVVALSDPRYYFSYSGKEGETSQRKIPVPTAFLESLRQVKEGKSEVRFPDLPSIETFKKILSDADAAVRSIAYTNLATVREKLFTDKIEWTTEKLHEELQKYKTKKDFIKKSWPAYNWASKNCMDLVDAHFGIRHVTLQEAIAAAKTCKNRFELMKLDRACYNFLLKNNRDTLDKVLPVKKKWTLEKCLELAKKAKRPVDFWKNRGASWFVRTHNHLEVINKILDKKRVMSKWLHEEDIIAAAKKAKTKTDFWSSSAGHWVSKNKRHDLVNHILEKIERRDAWDKRRASKEG